MSENYLHIEPTDSTPDVVFDRANKLFRISGDILPENSFDFFDPIFSWFSNYKKNPDDIIVIEFSINIINTSSTRRLVSFFKLLEEIADNGSKITIIWAHLPDDEIMQYTAYEFGNAFKKLTFQTRLK